jgi:hypothetical protein
VDEGQGKATVDLVAQGVDVHFDDIADAVEVDVPDVLPR